MISSGSAIRLVSQYTVQGVNCYTRAHFITGAGISEADLPANAAILSNEWGNRFRALLSDEATLTQNVIDVPDRPDISPVGFLGGAPGVRAGGCLPAHLHLMLSFYWFRSPPNKAIRNSMKISGISVVDHRQNHVISALATQLLIFGEWMRTSTGLGGAMQCRPAVAKPQLTSPTSYDVAPVQAFNLPTAFRSLKSRQQ